MARKGKENGKCLIRAKGSDLVFLAFWEQVLGTPINLISCSILVQNIVNEYSKTSFVTNGKLHYFQTGKNSGHKPHNNKQ